jgi:uncharacterized protein (DUF2235 family)
MNSDERIDVFRFADTALSPNVDYGRHAVSLDEQRDDFEPTLWDKRDNVSQVLFPGAHADVGGGYPSGQTGLSDGALCWMFSELKNLGVMFGSEPPSGDPLGVGHRPWLQGVFASLRHSPRVILERAWQDNVLGFHQSLQDRLEASRTVWEPDDGTSVYVPTVLRTAIENNSVWVKP